MGKCPHCGAEFAFDPKSQLVHCDYCGSDFNPTELKENIKGAKVDEFEGKAFMCTQCGATLLTFDETAITFCSYCGSQNMIEEKMMKVNSPNYIIPFSITKDQCIANYKKKVAGFLFCPSYMKSELVLNKIRGIYMPYGIYKLGHNGMCRNHGQTYSHRMGDYVYYNDYSINADVDVTYDGLSYDLLSKFYDDYSMSIPFNFKKVENFNSNYLSGFYADTKDVDESVYLNDALYAANTDTTRLMSKTHAYRSHGCYSPHVNLDVKDVKTGMFPVYFLAIHDKKKEHLHYAVINGQTGKVAADLPIDFFKYILFSLVVAIPIFFFLMTLPIILPIAIDFFAIIAAIIGGIICITQLDACENKENLKNDKGYLYSKKENVKLKNSFFPFKYAWKYLLAVLVSLIPIITHPVNDLYYYIASFISLSLILLSFFDLVKIHNRLVSRPIPQLEKRGGDENA